MVLEPGKPQTLRFRGEVVEIFEAEGARLAKIKMDAFDVLEIAAECLGETHLGDSMAIEAKVTIDQIKPE
jgi:hypothetical protein